MSSNLNYKQASNVERRTWDREAYEAKAKARKNSSKNAGPVRQQPGVGSKRPREEEEPLEEEFTPAMKGAAGPMRSKRAFLKARTGRVDIDSRIGSTELVTTEEVATSKTTTDANLLKTGVTKTGVGWHCKVCDCFLKDSHTYLDHINGRKHQRNLGYSMRTERSTTEQVQDRLKLLVEKQASTDQEEDLVKTDLADIVKSKEEQAERRKKERARKKEERKRRLAEEEKEEEEGINPDLAAMMGFSGFGGVSKTR